MSRRCKIGQRARVVDDGPNRGRIVLVLRPYHGEEIDGSTWVEKVYPWVVTALGAPLIWFKDRQNIHGKSLVAVLDDTALEPLSDDDDGLQVKHEQILRTETPT